MIIKLVKDSRLMFRAMDSSAHGDARALRKIALAADRAMNQVDYETVELFRKYNLPLPEELAKKAWD